MKIAELTPGLAGSFVQLIWGEGLLGQGSEKLQYAALTLPGLLQDPAYVRAALSAGANPGAKPRLNLRVDLRLQRQQVLNGPAHFVFILDEAVLRRMHGGRRAMSNQLGHLAAMAQRPNITILVLPFSIGLYPGMGPGYEILDITANQSHLYMEYQVDGRYEVNPPDLPPYRVHFRRARQAALSAPASLSFISKLAAELSTGGA